MCNILCIQRSCCMHSILRTLAELSLYKDDETLLSRNKLVSSATRSRGRRGKAAITLSSIHRRTSATASTCRYCRRESNPPVSSPPPSFPSTRNRQNPFASPRRLSCSLLRSAFPLRVLGTPWRRRGRHDRQPELAPFRR
jgi:hypothetical protein